MSYRVTDPRDGRSVIIRRSADYFAATQAAHTCVHGQTELRLWTNKNGSKGAWQQCLWCGDRRGNAIGLGTAAQPPPADDGLAERWRAQVKERIDTITIKAIDKQLTSDAEFWEPYQQYLESEAWLQKRAFVLKRCGGVCEGCGSAPATQAHHMTYEHVYNEFLFELKGLCEPCHKRWHADESA